MIGKSTIGKAVSERESIGARFPGRTIGRSPRSSFCERNFQVAKAGGEPLSK